MQKTNFTHRIATKQDVHDIINLMQLSIEENMKDFLSAEQIEANKESMGVDQTLIDDGTYFVIEVSKEGKTVMVGCGGWGSWFPCRGLGQFPLPNHMVPDRDLSSEVIFFFVLGNR